MDRLKFEFRYRLNKIKYFFTDTIWFELSFRLPNKLLYHAVIVVWAHATARVHTDKSPDEVTWTEALNALEER